MKFTLPETNSLPMDGWKEQAFPIGFRPAYFQGAKMLVSGRVRFLLQDCLETTP